MVQLVPVVSDHLDLARNGERVVGLQDTGPLEELTPVSFGSVGFKGGAVTGVLGPRGKAAMAAVFYPGTGPWSHCLVEGYGMEPSDDPEILSAWWDMSQSPEPGVDVAVLETRQNPRQVQPDVSKKFANGRTLSTFAVEGYSFTGPQIVIPGDAMNPVEHPRQIGDH